MLICTEIAYRNNIRLRTGGIFYIAGKKHEFNEAT